MTTTLTATVRWIPVPGGTCLFGDNARPRQVPDLLVAETPLTWRQRGKGDLSDRPVTGIDHTDALRLATESGGRLPSSVEWEWIAAGPRRHLYPWGDEPWTPQRAVLTGDGHTPLGTLPVGLHPAGANPHGVLGLAGNVWEWTATPVMGSGFVIRGGSYASKPLYARTTFLNAVPAERRSPGIAVRPVRPA
ncbi:MAG TPA: SUMF1/EgtB/PvdO family nonheme iron enzyme [Catenuloplanes sp.]